MNDTHLVYFDIFPWNKNFETGIALIDEQHQKLVHILNQLAAHLANRSDAIMLGDIFDELAAYADYHFKSEEEIWSKHFNNDEWYLSHQKTHHSFIDEVIALRNDDSGKSLDDIVYSVVTFLSKWLAYHILDTDKRMAYAVIMMESGKSLEEAKADASEAMSGAMKVIIETVLTMYESLSTRTLDLMREKALRIQAEEALKQSEERWKFIVESNLDAAWDFNFEQDKLTKTATDESIFNIAGDNTENCHKASVIHPADLEQVNSDFQAHMEGQSDFFINKHRVMKPNGSWSWVLSRGKVISRDEYGNPKRMIGTHTDITERELVSLIHKNSSQAIFITDNENRIVSVNPAFAQITGYSETDSLGQNPNFLASGIHEKAFYKEMWKALKGLGYWRGKITNRKKDGTLFTEYIEIYLVRDPNGDVDHYIGMFNDITQEEMFRKDQENQRDYLIQQSRMAQMGELISMIAHQWKQPLGIITSTASILQMKLTLNKFDLSHEEGQKECVTFFDSNLQQINELVHNLSMIMDDFRNFYNPNKQSSSVLIESPASKALYIIRASLRSDGIEVVEHYNSQKMVTMYENEVIQVILNVLKNAQDNFREQHIPNPTITISTHSTENGTVMEICNNGGRIPEEIIGKIFDPYFSTKSEKGTGLGLHMSKQIIETNHHGKFYAENRENSICFIIELYERNEQ